MTSKRDVKGAKVLFCCYPTCGYVKATHRTTHSVGRVERASMLLCVTNMRACTAHVFLTKWLRPKYDFASRSQQSRWS